MGNKQREKQYWNNIQEVNDATINDRSMTIERNDIDITKSSTERISGSDGKIDSTLSRLGIPALVIQRTSSISSSGCLKNGQGPLRPRSIVSVVEMSVEETQDNALVLSFIFLFYSARQFLYSGQYNSETRSLYYY